MIGSSGIGRLTAPTRHPRPTALPRYVIYVGGQGVLEGLGTAEGQALLLAGPAWSYLDGGTQNEAWTLGLDRVKWPFSYNGLQRRPGQVALFKKIK